MLFTSLTFVVFAVVFFPLYFALKGRARTTFVLLSSYFFYGWWDYRFVSLLILSSIVDFRIGLALERAPPEGRRRKALVTASVVTNLSILGFFKYCNFFIESFYDAFLPGAESPALNIVLPVGISFYTFQTLSYSIDLYRRKIERAERDFLTFAAYVALFPQLVAGPIVRASSLLPQMHENATFDIRRIARGLELVIWGFFLKLCLADTAATVVDPRFSTPEGYGALSHAVGVWAFAMQIYGDFSGYSLIAIGLGRCMGFDFGVNFNRPYFARNFSNFWERWHISLSQWLRDYLYIPLGGNRGGQAKTLRNLMLTMLLGGLWHGAGYVFIIWGALHGSYLIAQRLLAPGWQRLTATVRLPELCKHAVEVFTVFMLTCLAWVFFRAEDVDTATLILGKIGSLEGLKIRGGEQTIGIFKTVLVAMVVALVDWAGTRPRIRAWYMERVWARTVAMLMIGWSLILLGTFKGASFLYFQF